MAYRKWKSKKMDFFPRASRKKAALLSSWFYLSKIHFGLLTSRAVGEEICVVLSQLVCGNSLQQQWKTNSIVYDFPFISHNQKSCPLHSPLHCVQPALSKVSVIYPSITSDFIICDILLSPEEDFLCRQTIQTLNFNI